MESRKEDFKMWMLIMSMMIMISMGKDQMNDLRLKQDTHWSILTSNKTKCLSIESQLKLKIMKH